MTSDVEIREVPSQPAALVRASTPASEIGSVLPRVIGNAYEFIRRNGIAPSGPPIAVYYEFQPGQVSYAGGVPVGAAFPGDSTVESSALPSGRVAFARHLGPYSGLGETYDAIQRWATDNGYALTLPCWESYPMPPGGEPDESKLVTEVFYPIA